MLGSNSLAGSVGIVLYVEILTMSIIIDKIIRLNNKYSICFKLNFINFSGVH